MGKLALHESQIVLNCGRLRPMMIILNQDILHPWVVKTCGVLAKELIIVYRYL